MSAFTAKEKKMRDGEVHTRAKDRVLTDRVYESPVDQYQARFRRRAGIVVLVLLLIAIAV
jgi:hypothetical protein